MTGESMAVSLAHTAPFALGPLHILPAAREIERDGTRETIEPLVMQLLIALAQDAGAVVSRDTLIDRCWDGRAISEDALNRVVAKVRRISMGIGNGAFVIETVTKVGYRLRVAVSGQSLSDARPDVAIDPGFPRRRLILAGLGVAAVGGPLLLSLRHTRQAASAPPSPHGSDAPIVIAASDLETRGLSLMFQGTAEQTSAGIAYLRQATAIAPRQASLWGSLAMGYVLLLAFAGPPETSEIASRAVEAARRGLSLDRREGRSAAALVSLSPTHGHWAEKDRELGRAMAQAAPETPPLMFQHAQFLASVGRTGDALRIANRLVAISPLLPWIQSLRSKLLAASGRPDEAQRAADRAAELWPRDRLTWFTRFDLALFGGRPKDALVLAEEHSHWPADSDADIADRLAIAHTLLAPAPAAIDRLLDHFATRAGADRTAAETALQAAAALGRPDRAFAFARRMYVGSVVLPGRGVVMPRVGRDDGTDFNTALLFWPPVVGLRADPGYAVLLRDLGLDRFAH